MELGFSERALVKGLLVRRAVKVTVSAVLTGAAVLAVAGCAPAAPTTPAASSGVAPGCPESQVAPVERPGAVPSSALNPPDRLYAVNNHLDPAKPVSDPGVVDVVDPATNAVTATFEVGAQPHHIYPVPHSNEAYVSHFVGCSMDVVDLTSNKVIGQVATGFGPRHLTFDPTGSLAYTANYPAGTVSVIDTTTNTTVGTIPAGKQPNYTETTADGSRVFIVNSGANTVTVAQAHAPFTVTDTLTVGAHPFSLALTPDGGTMVVTNAGEDTVSLIDVSTLAVSAPISLHAPGAAPTPPDGKTDQKLNVRITRDGRYAWVGDQAGSAFSVIDLSTRSLVDVLPAASGADIATEIRTGPSTGLSLTTARYGNYLDVVTASPPSLVGHIVTAPTLPETNGPGTSYTGKTGPQGVGSHMVVTNPEGTRAYVSDRPGGAVTVIDLSTGHPQFLTNIPVSGGAHGFPDGLAYVHFSTGIATAPAG
ncbi:MAG: hypothetical protein NVS2B15_17680 [Pseudarthrobacter sp.]